MSRAWFKFYGRDFRDGVRALSWDEVGIYTVLLTLMYDANGAVPDDAQHLSRMIGCDVRLWKRVRAKLIESGKIRLTEDGSLTNDRVEIEVRSAEDVRQVRAISGRSGGQQSGISRAKAAKTKESDEANASIVLPYTRASAESEHRTQKEDAAATPRASACPAVIVANAVNSPFLDMNKNRLGETSGEVGRWLAAGADLELDVIPTVARLTARQREPVKTWGYFTDAVRKAASQRLAPVEPIQPGEVSHVSTPNHPADAPRQSVQVRPGVRSASSVFKELADRARVVEARQREAGTEEPAYPRLARAE